MRGALIVVLVAALVAGCAASPWPPETGAEGIVRITDDDADFMEDRVDVLRSRIHVSDVAFRPIQGVATPWGTIAMTTTDGFVPVEIDDRGFLVDRNTDQFLLGGTAHLAAGSERVFIVEGGTLGSSTSGPYLLASFTQHGDLEVINEDLSALVADVDPSATVVTGLAVDDDDRLVMIFNSDAPGVLVVRHDPTDASTEVIRGPGGHGPLWQRANPGGSRTAAIVGAELWQTPGERRGPGQVVALNLDDGTDRVVADIEGAANSLIPWGDGAIVARSVFAPLPTSDEETIDPPTTDSPPPVIHVARDGTITTLIDQADLPTPTNEALAAHWDDNLLWLSVSQTSPGAPVGFERYQFAVDLTPYAALPQR